MLRTRNCQHDIVVEVILPVTQNAILTEKQNECDFIESVQLEAYTIDPRFYLGTSPLFIIRKQGTTVGIMVEEVNKWHLSRTTSNQLNRYLQRGDTYKKSKGELLMTKLHPPNCFHKGSVSINDIHVDKDNSSNMVTIYREATLEHL